MKASVALLQQMFNKYDLSYMWTLNQSCIWIYDNK